MILKKTILFALTICIISFSNFSCSNCCESPWSYTEKNTPECWPKCFPDCDGKMQTPIDITGSETGTELSALVTNYSAAPINLMNRNYSVYFDFNPGNSIQANGTTFYLKDFHVHMKSEHTVKGNYFPMELHLVHLNEAQDAAAVIGLFFEEGSENAVLETFIDHLPTSDGQTFADTTKVNPINLLPSSSDYYNYQGSLTTPECSEIVSWYLMKEPVKASKEQLDKISKIIEPNYRPIQDLNGRKIKEYNQ